MPEAHSASFWHFWHPLTLGIPRIMLLGQGPREGYINATTTLVRRPQEPGGKGT